MSRVKKSERMRTHMPRAAVRVGLAAVLAAAATGVAAQRSAGAVGANPPPQSSVALPGLDSTPAVSRELLDRYCVGCHNTRTKAEGRPAFDEIDFRQIGKHAPVLEKIVRKLRSGQMPPDGSRKPDPVALETFVTALEAALDRDAAQMPNPGRVA